MLETSLTRTCRDGNGRWFLGQISLTPSFISCRWTCVVLLEGDRECDLFHLFRLSRAISFIASFFPKDLSRRRSVLSPVGGSISTAILSRLCFSLAAVLSGRRIGLGGTPLLDIERSRKDPWSHRQRFTEYKGEEGLCSSKNN